MGDEPAFVELAVKLIFTPGHDGLEPEDIAIEMVGKLLIGTTETTTGCELETLAPQSVETV